jgi:hypothetical protein
MRRARPRGRAGALADDVDNNEVDDDDKERDKCSEDASEDDGGSDDGGGESESESEGSSDLDDGALATLVGLGSDEVDALLAALPRLYCDLRKRCGPHCAFVAACWPARWAPPVWVVCGSVARFDLQPFGELVVPLRRGAFAHVIARSMYPVTRLCVKSLGWKVNSKKATFAWFDRWTGDDIKCGPRSAAFRFLPPPRHPAYPSIAAQP